MDNNSSLATRIINLENVVTSLNKLDSVNSIGLMCLGGAGIICAKILWDLTDDLYDARIRIIELEDEVKKITEDTEARIRIIELENKAKKITEDNEKCDA